MQLNDNLQSDLNRREFLQFMGRRSAGLTAAVALSPLALQLLTACSTLPLQKNTAAAVEGLPFTPLLPQSTDFLELAPGFQSQVLIKWGQPLNAREDFGFNNDFIGMVPFKDSSSEAYLWVNHEASDPQFVSGHHYYNALEVKTKPQAELEMKSVGGSILHVRKNDQGEWKVVNDSLVNRRYDAFTRIPFAGEVSVRDAKTAMGTLANCSGGVTPWQTFLTCEENYHHYYGEASYSATGSRSLKPARAATGWDPFYHNPPEHYGWVTEIDPVQNVAQKLTALGRFAHEGATCVTAKDGRAVVYMGDDTDDQCFYKFIADKTGSLVTGTLYVASLERGEWLPIDLKQSPILRQRFKDHTEMMIRIREAALLLGGTKLDRPEDCDVDPATGAIIIACTNNKPAERPFGALLRIEEMNADFLSLKFTSKYWRFGGEQTGFACPDNLAFDQAGNLWMTTDISDDALNKDEYAFHGNNALFVIPMKGRLAGQAFRVATAPMDAELTGPCFSPDGKTLFLSIQHPGINSRGPENLTSHWPDGGNKIPRPAVVTIQGPALEAMTLV